MMTAAVQTPLLASSGLKTYASVLATNPDDLRRADQDLASKFGPLTVFFFSASNRTPRHCLAYVRAFDDPRLQLSGWFCQGGSEFIQQSTLACALDRLTLLAAGSEPKVGALFAQAERKGVFAASVTRSWRPHPSIICSGKHWRAGQSHAASDASASPIEKRILPAAFLYARGIGGLQVVQHDIPFLRV